MSVLKGFKSAAMMRPMLNIGCLQDIPTGTIYKGKKGEHYVCGGVTHFEGFAGLPNMFKTVMALFRHGVVMARYPSAAMLAHDSENTLTVERILQIWAQFPELSEQDLIDTMRLVFSDAGVYTGTEWFEAIKDFSKERRADMSNRMTTPFWDHRRLEFVKIPSPVLVLLDSLSGLQTESVQNMYEKADIGESGLNMVAMKGAAAKSQMIDQMTSTTTTGGIYAMMTAHVGQEHQLDQYKPNLQKLKFMKQGTKIKKIPENFLFLVGTCYQATHLEVLMDDKKLPEFPRDSDDDEKGNTDLIRVEVLTLRCKTGPSGIYHDILISQADGVQVGLTEFYHCKKNNRYGIGGNLQNYHLELLPDVNLTRKSIRKKIDDNAALQRALTITSEMHQIKTYWHWLEEEQYCSPKELYDDLKAKGYDWELLLNTRGYWTFEEDNNPIPFLSTYDLLLMRTGEYHPYWYPKTAQEMGIVLKEAATVEWADKAKAAAT